MEARDRFIHARRLEPEIQALLLVDSEEPVSTTTKQHLFARDGWPLPDVPTEAVHLMVQVMETWMVADPEALSAFYGRDFNEKALPAHADLEQVPKSVVADALNGATKHTQKRAYHKIRLADVLARLRPGRVRARCKHCELMFSTAESLIGT